MPRAAAPYDVVVGHGLLDRAARPARPRASQRVAVHPPRGRCARAAEAVCDDARGAAATTSHADRGARRRGRPRPPRSPASCWAALGRAGLHPLRRGRRRRRRRDHRPGRLRRRDLAARRPRRARADHAARHGRRRGRRQDRHQHRRGQEPRRRVPRAGRRAVRPATAARRCRATTWSAGLAEVVKCGFIADPAILDLVEARPGRRGGPAGAVLRELVERAVRVKADVVAGDLRGDRRRRRGRAARRSTTATRSATRSSGSRATRWRHGDAVAVGMVFAAELARLAGRLDDATADRHRAVLALLGPADDVRGRRLAGRCCDAMRRGQEGPRRPAALRRPRRPGPARDPRRPRPRSCSPPRTPRIARARRP